MEVAPPVESSPAQAVPPTPAPVTPDPPVPDAPVVTVPGPVSEDSPAPARLTKVMKAARAARAAKVADDAASAAEEAAAVAEAEVEAEQSVTWDGECALGDSGRAVVARKTNPRTSPSAPASRDAIPAYRGCGGAGWRNGWEDVGDGRFLLMGGRRSRCAVVARKARPRKSPSTPASRDAIPAYRGCGGPDGGMVGRTWGMGGAF